MPRSSWTGFLKLSLVSVPVKAYTASVSSGGEIHLNQLHEECHSRIRYQKVCPIHGEVPNNEIVSGYEYSKGQYVVIDPSELDKLRTPADKAITLDAFVAADAIDPVYFSGKTYYLVPDGPIGQKPYSLIRQVMEEEGLMAVAQVVMTGRERLVLIRPIGTLLGMTDLSYEHQVKKPSAFEDEIETAEFQQAELDLTKQLVSAFVKDEFDLSVYKDQYTQKLTELIEAKVQGKEIVAPARAEEPQVINLMEALRQSVANAQGSAPASPTPATKKKAAPKRKMAKSSPKAAAKKKTRKSG